MLTVCLVATIPRADGVSRQPVQTGHSADQRNQLQERYTVQCSMDFKQLANQE